MYVFPKPSATINMRILGSCFFFAVLAACGDATPDPPSGERPLPAATTDSSRAPGATPTRPEPDSVSSLPTVVFFGTSLTAGLGLPSEEDTYAAHAAELAADAGVPFRPVYAGVSGETTAAGVRRIDWVTRNTPVDVLVLELGANDGLRGLDVEAMRANLEHIIDATRARHPEARIVLMGMEAPTNLGERYTTDFRNVFVDVARERGTYLVPFFLDGVAGVAELNQSDGIHPNEEGHHIMARNLMPVLTRALESVYTDRDPPAAPGGADGSGADARTGARPAHSADTAG